MPKITLFGAGSGFCHTLFMDIFHIEGLKSGTACLVDIDAKRLDLSVRVLRRIIDTLGLSKWKIEASTDRRKVLKGTDFIINSIEVSGTKCVRHDNDIPLKYGIDQCIGDTIGPGGIMKALRTLPPFLGILDDAARLCPNAPIMNYTNPMSIMSLAALRHTSQPFAGLCHSVQGTYKLLARYMGIPHEELVWRCGGINHMAWYTVLEHKGKNAYPLLFNAMKNKEIYEKDPIRFEIMKEFGYFVTESSGHFSEYVPYYRKRKDLVKKYARDGYRGGSSFYADCWPGWRRNRDAQRRKILAGKAEIKARRSHEYGADIIEAIMFGRQKTIYGSVLNTGLIPNLPQTGVVEVPVTVDKNGFTPGYFGPLPEQLAALCRSNMAVFELCAQGILDKDREAVIHSMMLDPLSAAVCSPAEIRAMAEELFKAERQFIPSWLKPAGKR